ncbi:TIR domain-containing protein [Thiothrix nivea]|uniref:nSTAND1 domain-containing NTPase n=1 Tax=Thiothrix nivea TaxID=1031 RepID=UPI0002DF9EDF|nr:TIR domain-containing protein [Thiothrix nivea]
MAKIFISHSSQDKAEAVQLMQWLESKGFEFLFLDSDARHGIKAGSEWEKTLYHEIHRADAFIFLLSDHWISSQWCGFEFMQARALGKSIFPLRIQAGLQTSIASDIQHLDLTEDREEKLQRLLTGLTELTLNIQQRFVWDKERPPYPGMLAFEEADAPVFFGRDAEINRLRERLQQLRTQGGDSLLVMLAASGAGKSSLLKAGLLPRLRRDAQRWIVLDALRPEQEPLRKLAQVLLDVAGETDETAEASLYQQLQGEQALDALQQRIRQLRSRSQQREATLLLSIDQAEELFSTAPPAETTQLLQLLARAQAERLPLLTLMALRSDYLEALQTVADKPPFSLFALDPLPLERVSDLIRGPAAVVGLAVEDGLITAATHDAATADALPLLAFALRELYERFGADGDLTLDEYRRLGSDTLNPLENAVQHKASEAIQPDRLGAEALQALRDAFIPHMVRVNDAGDYARQPARWDDLSVRAQPLLDQLTNARLLVQRSDERGKRVEVAHEALLRHWRLLNGWLREEHDFLLGKQQLEHSLRDWLQLPEAQRNKGLLQGIALERAREWLFANRAGLSAAEKDYIRHSHQAEETKRKAEEQRRKKERQRLIGGVIMLAMVAALAMWQAFSARASEQRAELSLNEANNVINFINFDLRDKLRPIGRLDIMNDVQARVSSYYDNLGDNIQGDELQRQCATNLKQ